MPGMSAIPQELPVTRRIDLVVIHCSATPSGKRLGLPGQSPAEVIDAWHKARGFQRGVAARSAHNWRLAHIGYHAVIDVDGTLWTGRHSSEVGAHVAGFNSTSLGVCLVGGAEPEGRYTLAQWNTLRNWVREMAVGNGIPLRMPPRPRAGGGVVGHRDLSPDADADGTVERHEWLKTCPGFDVAAWLHGGMQPLPMHVVAAA